jgi:hypothetical protein
LGRVNAPLVLLGVGLGGLVSLVLLGVESGRVSVPGAARCGVGEG